MRTRGEIFGEAVSIDPNGLIVPAVARGDTLLDEAQDAALKSELEGVSDERWTQFVRGMATEDLSNVSPLNALGMFSITPRRLADLKLVVRLTRSRSPAGKTIWVAAFVPPLTPKRFLTDPQLQYAVFCKSCRDYVSKMDSGEIEKDPEMSKSGALAILHRAGPNGLRSWSTGERFTDTIASYERVAGIF